MAKLSTYLCLTICAVCLFANLPCSLSFSLSVHVPACLLPFSSYTFFLACPSTCVTLSLSPFDPSTHTPFNPSIHPSLRPSVHPSINNPFFSPELFNSLPPSLPYFIYIYHQFIPSILPPYPSPPLSPFPPPRPPSSSFPHSSIPPYKHNYILSH